MKTRILILMVLLLSVNFSYAQKEIDDLKIVDAVEDQFRFDHAVDVNRISIESINGIIEITGTVNNIKAKERAAKLAEMVKGVRSVSNRIDVNPPKTVNDTDVKNSIEMALLNDPAADSYEVDVSVDNGVVILKGTVNSHQEKQLSEDVAKSVAGVVGLNNQLNVNYKTNRSDFEIKKDIQETLKWNRWVDDGLIEVEVNNGNVQLSGVVGSASERRTASWSSWVAGVKSVDNSQLNVQWWAKDVDLRANKNVDVRDDEIKSAVMDVTMYDPRVYSFNVEPEVSNGWVTLRGTVDNLKARNAAETLAKNTYGVSGVTNRLKVKGNETPTDDEIQDKIESALTANAITDSWKIGVFVNNGMVTLSGTVDSYLERNEAEWVASGIEGVSAINNIMSVNYPYTYYWYGNYPHYEWYYPTPDSPMTISIFDDNAIKREVENELWWSPFVDSDQVTVSVDNGEVTLKGTVDSWKEYRKAAENAWEGGAWSLNNQLIVIVDYEK